MKNLKFRNALLLMLTAIVSLSACDNSSKTGGSEVPTQDFVSYNGNYTELNSMFVVKKADSYFVYLSADQVTSAADLIAEDADGTPKHQYFEIQLDGSYANATVDVKSATAPFAFINKTQIAAEISDVTNDDTSKLQAGSIKLDLTTANRAEITFSFTASAGGVLNGESSCAFTAMPVATTNEVYENGEKKSDLGFSYFADFSVYKMAILSPVTEFEDWADIINNNHPYIMVLIDGSLVGKKLDLTTETEAFQVMSNVTADEILFDNSDASSIKYGTLKYDIDEQKNVVISGYIELTSGNIMTFAANGVFSEPDFANNITVGEDVFPIQSAFDKSDEDVCQLYFTPQDVETGDDAVENAKSYVMLFLDKTLLNQEFDITQTKSSFSVVFSDDYSETMFYVMNENTNGSTGTVKVEKTTDAERTYNITVNIVDENGKAYKLVYNGQCKPYYQEPDNAFSVQGVEVAPIKSAVIDTTAAVYQIWFSSQENLTTVDAIKASEHNIGITLPSTCFDGESWGFSRDASISIIYKGVTYGLGNPNDRGTIVAELNGTEATISFKEWGTPIDGYYHGEVTLIK